MWALGEEVPAAAGKLEYILSGLACFYSAQHLFSKPGGRDGRIGRAAALRNGLQRDPKRPIGLEIRCTLQPDLAQAQVRHELTRASLGPLAARIALSC